MVYSPPTPPQAPQWQPPQWQQTPQWQHGGQTKRTSAILPILIVVAVALGMIAVIVIAYSLATAQNDADAARAQQQSTAVSHQSLGQGEDPDAGRNGDSSTDAPSGVTEAPGANSNMYDRYAENTPGSQNQSSDIDSKIANGILINSMEPGSGTQDRIHSQQYSITDAQRQVYPDNKWLTWDIVYPGTTVGMPAGPDYYGMCTLGFIGFSEENGAPAGITAGHCMDGTDGYLEWKSSQKTTLDPLGQFVGGQTINRSIDGGFAGTTDFAVFGLEKGIEGDSMIANNYTVTEVMDPKDITPGMQLCKFGFRTMETCGPVVASNDEFVRVNLYSMVGDSGGPLYLKHDPNAPIGEGTVTAVGILSGSPVVNGQPNDALTDFALIKPIVDHTHIDIVVKR